MNNQQVQNAYSSVQTIFNSQSSYENLSTSDVIAYLNDGVAKVGVDLQLAFDCLNNFKCRGFKVEEKMAALSDLAESFGLNDHVVAVRNLQCIFGTEHNTQL